MKYTIVYSDPASTLVPRVKFVEANTYAEAKAMVPVQDLIFFVFNGHSEFTKEYLEEIK